MSFNAKFSVLDPDVIAVIIQISLKKKKSYFMTRELCIRLLRLQF